MQKNEPLVIVGLAVLAFLLLTSAKQNNSLSTLNFDALKQAGYDSGDVDLLNEIYTALVNNGSLTDQQLMYCLAQIVHETGLFTDVTNYVAIEQRHNWAGLGGYGSYKVYPNDDAFVSDYLSPAWLAKKSMPLQATSLSDFNDRLFQNGFYDTTIPGAKQNYLNGLNNAMTILNQAQ